VSGSLPTHLKSTKLIYMRTLPDIICLTLAMLLCTTEVRGSDFQKGLTAYDSGD